MLVSVVVVVSPKSHAQLMMLPSPASDSSVNVTSNKLTAITGDWIYEKSTIGLTAVSGIAISFVIASDKSFSSVTAKLTA